MPFGFWRLLRVMAPLGLLVISFSCMGGPGKSKNVTPGYLKANMTVMAAALASSTSLDSNTTRVPPPQLVGLSKVPNSNATVGIKGWRGEKPGHNASAVSTHKHPSKRPGNTTTGTLSRKEKARQFHNSKMQKHENGQGQSGAVKNDSWRLSSNKTGWSLNSRRQRNRQEANGKFGVSIMQNRQFRAPGSNNSLGSNAIGDQSHISGQQGNGVYISPYKRIRRSKLLARHVPQLETAHSRIGRSTTPQEVPDILFIGNSYTSSNNLPDLIRNVAISVGKNIAIGRETQGGFNFERHVQNPDTFRSIEERPWDAVVLQEQSQRPSFRQPFLESSVYPPAARLANAVHENNNCTRLMFFQTWGRENGDSSNCRYIPEVCTFDGMNSRLQSTYLTLAERNNGEVIPVGAAWKYVRDNHTEINLYSDGSHPSVSGSYLAAMAFYTSLFWSDPREVNYFGRLDEATARKLQQAVYTVVTDDLDTWHLRRQQMSTNCSTSAFNSSLPMDTTNYEADTTTDQMDIDSAETTAPIHAANGDTQPLPSSSSGIHIAVIIGSTMGFMW